MDKFTVELYYFWERKELNSSPSAVVNTSHISTTRYIITYVSFTNKNIDFYDMFLHAELRISHILWRRCAFLALKFKLSFKVVNSSWWWTFRRLRWCWRHRRIEYFLQAGFFLKGPVGASLRSQPIGSEYFSRWSTGEFEFPASVSLRLEWSPSDRRMNTSIVSL